MRKSVNKNDPGYDPEAYRYEAFLDGIKLDLCFTADEELGKAWIYKDNKSNEVIELSGKVEIKCQNAKAAEKKSSG